MDNKTVEKINTSTKLGYNNIASNYARSRALLSNDLKLAIQRMSMKGKILDSGSADARLFDISQEYGAEYYAIDNSEELCRLAERKGDINIVCGDILDMPYEDNFFDQIYSSSVFHHIPDKQREQFMAEHHRILKPGGRMLIRVWDLKKNTKAKPLIMINNIKNFFGLSELGHNDILFPWKNIDQSVAMMRYFHCFTMNELIKLAKNQGFVIEDKWEDGKAPDYMNLYLILRK